MTRLWLLIVLLSPGWGADLTKTLIVGRGADGLAPVFDHGYLAFIKQSSSAVEVWGPDGWRYLFTSVENPHGADVYSIAVAADGSVAAGLAFWATDSFHGGIVYFDASGQQTRFIDTGSYTPTHLTFDKNRSLWTFGWMRDARNAEDHSDYMLFRKYSADGAEAGRYVPRSVFASKGLSSGYPGLGRWHFTAVDDRIDAIVSYRQDGSKRAWVELAIDDGRITGIWPLGRDSSWGMAFTHDGRLCRQMRDKTKASIECLDRDTVTWSKLGEIPRLGVLMGADGDQLVFRQNEGVIRLSWVKP